MEPKLMWKQGIAARMQCTVKGSDELKASWFLNDNDLSDGDKHTITFKAGLATLEIIDVNVLDSGNYTCEVSNEAGSESSITELSVKDTPSFRKELQMVEAVKGTPAVHECEIKGTAPFEIIWLKNKKPVVATDKKNKIIYQESIARLEFCSFESADIGDYQCCIANDVGQITTKTLAKLKEPPTFAKKIETITATLGYSVKLQGTLKVSPPISIKWMRDTEMLRDDDPDIKMTFENNIAILSITAVAISHGGKYTCQAENETGQNKYDATLTVQEPAKVLEKAESINLTSGDSATLECKIAGSPDLRVKWFHDGKEMKGNRKYKITLKDNIVILKIIASEKADSSEYRMEVSNRVGKDQCSITVLDHIILPFFTKSLKRLDRIMGKDISMDCKVSGSQPMILSWFKDEKEIKSGDGYLPEIKDNSAALKITKLEKVDAGVYTCRATNSTGSKESSGTLYVKGL
ncbi:contactin-5-like [Salvelinus alpinus]